MNQSFFYVLLGSLFLGASAHAVPAQPDPVEEVSPALQIARRVAAIENDNDLPSRAVWLGKKVAAATQADRAKTLSSKRLSPEE